MASDNSHFTKMHLSKNVCKMKAYRSLANAYNNFMTGRESKVIYAKEVYDVEYEYIKEVFDKPEDFGALSLDVPERETPWIQLCNDTFLNLEPSNRFIHGFEQYYTYSTEFITVCEKSEEDSSKNEMKFKPEDPTSVDRSERIPEGFGAAFLDDSQDEESWIHGTSENRTFVSTSDNGNADFNDHSYSTGSSGYDTSQVKSRLLHRNPKDRTLPSMDKQERYGAFSLDEHEEERHWLHDKSRNDESKLVSHESQSKDQIESEKLLEIRLHEYQREEESELEMLDFEDCNYYISPGKDTEIDEDDNGNGLLVVVSITLIVALVIKIFHTYTR